MAQHLWFNVQTARVCGASTAGLIGVPAVARARYSRRWLEFRERFLYPALGILITVPLGVGITFAIASVAGWL